MGRGIELVAFSGWNNFFTGKTDWDDDFKGSMKELKMEVLPSEGFEGRKVIHF